MSLFNPPSVPAGSMLLWMTDAAPNGWLICDGSAISRTTFLTLFGVLGVIYGNGDGATTFNLPDMRGQFPRGRDAGAGVDPNAGTRTDRGDGTVGDVIGTKQVSDFASHTHDIRQDLFGSIGALANSVAANQGVSAFVANIALARGGAETRGINVYVNFIIRSG